MIIHFLNNIKLYLKIIIILSLLFIIGMFLFFGKSTLLRSESYYNDAYLLKPFEAFLENRMISLDENLTSFSGILTGYGPDCVGCGGKTGCAPRQDVRNGNIYYNDKIYGEIRIVASDPNIPCGSIVKISNFVLSKEPIIAIVLDRGGKVKGNKMDLLYTRESETIIVGIRRNVKFDILRWGW